ncbi:thioredoxin family protein [Fulvivirga ligni]|uniref:thioredoxin family protein n=1 Tax=Fulvivirga ligni TaxID=2904246 RepID=UPI001F4375F4|nr:thioredoxin family protein [Fulvivirga ligni]UII22331.1 thioredoxin family protein [Fulvivirga ligni]
MKKMKYITLAFLLSVVSLSVFAQDGESIWRTDFEAAIKEAKAENKPVLISFAGSDWCKPCIKLTREVFEDQKFQEYAKENLVLVLADFPRLKKNAIPKEQVKANEALAAKYNNDGAFPLVVLVDGDENVIAKTGYQAGGSENFINYLEKVINN